MRKIRVTFTDSVIKMVQVPDDARLSYSSFRDKYSYNYQETHSLVVWRSHEDMAKNSKDIMAVFRNVETFVEDGIEVVTVFEPNPNVQQNPR